MVDKGHVVPVKAGNKSRMDKVLQLPTIKYNGLAPRAYMYSASKTRSLSICLIMLISALSPLAVPVSASHESTPPLTLEINDNGTWVEVPSYTDPLIDGVGESGTFEFRFTSTNLTLNDTYSLDWSVEVCDWDDCTMRITSTGTGQR